MGKFLMVGAPAFTTRATGTFAAAAGYQFTLNPTTLGAQVGDTMVVFACFNVNNGSQSIAATAGWTALVPTGVNGENNISGRCTGAWWRKFAGSVPGSTTFGMTNNAASGTMIYGYAILQNLTTSPTNMYVGDGTMQPASTGTVNCPYYTKGTGGFVAFSGVPGSGGSETSLAFVGLDNISSHQSDANGVCTIGTGSVDKSTCFYTTNSVNRNTLFNMLVTFGSAGETVQGVGCLGGNGGSLQIDFSLVGAQTGDIIVVAASVPAGFSSISNTYGTWTIPSAVSLSNGHIQFAGVLLTSTPITTTKVTFTLSSGTGLVIAYWVIRNCQGSPCNLRSATAVGTFSNSTGAVGPNSTQTYGPGVIELDAAETNNKFSGESANYNSSGWSAFSSDGTASGYYGCNGWRPLSTAVSAGTVVSTQTPMRYWDSASLIL